MALGTTTVLEVEQAGSDTANGGLFDPGKVVSNAAIGAFTDGTTDSNTANTASPVFSSASYTILAGDVGAKIYIASGANWIPGWYTIVSVAGGKATLSAAIGAAVLASMIPSIAVGCASVGTPTGAVWAIDYSQQASAQFSYTDLASAGAGLTVSSAASPLGRQQIGNGLIIASGTNFTAGVYVIATVNSAVATVVGPGNITTGAGASGVGGLGGAFATPGFAAALTLNGMTMFVKPGTYVISSSTPNIAGGRISIPASSFSTTNAARMIGYGSVRGDLGTKPVIRASNTTDGDGSTLTGTTLLTFSNAGVFVENIEFFARSSNTTLKGVALSSGVIRRCKLTGFTLNAVSGAGDIEICEVTGCSTSAAVANSSGVISGCTIRSNTAGGISVTSATTIFGNLIADNTGVGLAATFPCRIVNNTIANNSSHGITAGGNHYDIRNNIIYGNGGSGINYSNANIIRLDNNAFGTNTSGNYTTSAVASINEVALSGDPFTNAASGDYSLNSTANRGAACKAAGIPGLFPGGLTTAYLDIGAVQHQDTGGGSAAGPLAGPGRLVRA